MLSHSCNCKNKLQLGHVPCVTRSSLFKLFKWTSKESCLNFECMLTNLLRYVNEILKSTPRSVDQVTVEPDGRWSQITQKDMENQTNRDRSSSEEDDDIVEIHEPRLAAIKDEALLTPSSMARTPPYSSREQSLSSGAPRSSSGKRSIGQVIDLTFSSDEEEQPPRGSKRQSTSNGHSSSHTSTGITTAQPLIRPNGFNFNLPRLTPAKPPEPLDYRFGDP